MRIGFGRAAVMALAPALAGGVMLAGGAARAATADDAQRLAAAVLAPWAVAASAPHSVAPLALTAKAGEGLAPARTPGVARTAIDRRLDGEATASLGFMCGLQPGTDRYGAGAAHGYDPTGRFVGAKLSLAFR